MRFFVLLLLWATACTPALVKEDRWADQGYTLTFNELPDGGTTTVDFVLLADVPPERLWNIVSDVEGFFRLTNNFELDSGPFMLDDLTMRMVVRVKPYWFSPSVTTVMVGRVMPERLGWENECESSVLKGCYMVFSVVPFDDGRRSMIKASGYMKRPWFITHGHMVEMLGQNFRSIAPGIRLVAGHSKYSVPNKRFPWADIAALHTRAGGAQVKTETRQRVAVQHLQVYPQATTNEAVGAITTDYLATRLTGSGAFEVITPSDMAVMARYLGQNWALVCKDDEACGRKLARMAESRYLLSGELRIEPAAYHVSLVMLDEKKGAAVWRMQRSLPPDLRNVKQVLDEATDELARTALP